VRWLAIILIVIGVIDLLAAANLMTQERWMDRKVGAHRLYQWLNEQVEPGTLTKNVDHRDVREAAMAVLERPHFLSTQAALGLALHGGLFIAAGIVLRRRLKRRDLVSTAGTEGASV
jgi:hypothetical protein